MSGPRPTALVTGASAGIGKAFAQQLAERGHDLVLVARNEERLAELAGELRSTYGVEAEVLVADLVERDDQRRVEARLADPERPVDLLVNNAGFGLKRRFLDNTADQETALLEIMVVAVMRLCHAAMGPMSERGRGGIINVSSVAASFPRGTYGAAKAWVNKFGEWAAAEYGQRGVQVMTLRPGFTVTEFHQRMDVRPGSGALWLDVDDLVREALADYDRGRTTSIPSLQYKALTLVSSLVPTRLLLRAQSLGRK
jgi:uncharacterized protein